MREKRKERWLRDLKCVPHFLVGPIQQQQCLPVTRWPDHQFVDHASGSNSIKTHFAVLQLYAQKQTVLTIYYS